MAHSVKQPRILELSEVHLNQQQLLGRDLDLENFWIVFRDKLQHQHRFQLREAILSASVTRTIDGASTLKVGIIDRDRTILRSGRLHNKLDVQIDGLWWRLAQVEKTGDILDLTFEDREIGVLRGYKDIILPINREKVTRGEFILRMLHEVKEFDIPYYIPEVHKSRPIFDDKGVKHYPADRSKGVNPDEKLTVKGAKANFNQKLNADAIMTQGDSQIPDSHPRKHKLLVCAIMTAIQESSINNIPPAANPQVAFQADSQGVFQQRPGAGWLDTMDVAIEARQFFEHALKVDAKYPQMSYNDLCQGVQISGYPNAYGQWKAEAEEWVASFGVLPQLARNANQQAKFDGLEGSYSFWRGIPPSRKNAQWKHEDSWACITRLSDEVGWRSFFVSGVFYCMSEDELFKSMPRSIINELNVGVNSIDGDIDRNKPTASLDIELEMGRYSIPPGATIKVVDTGPFNGRWLVESIDRDLFSPIGTINCKKPDPELAEPLKDTLPAAAKFSDIDQIGEPLPPYQKGPLPLIAQKIVNKYNNGMFRDDNGQQIRQWRKVAAGSSLHNQCGENVRLDQKLAEGLLWLMDAGWILGCFALVEDHSCKTTTGNKSQHSMGQAVDISSLGRKGFKVRSIAIPDLTVHNWIKEIMVQMRQLKPHQVICNGNGSSQLDIAHLQWNNGQQVNYITDDHTDHIHMGV